MSTKILDRIKKLLSLASSDNEHEAAAAAAAAAKLMMEHGIEQAQLEVHAAPEAVGEVGIDDGGKIPAWKGVLLHGLATAFDCRSVDLRGYGRSVLTVFGQPSKTATIVYMYQYLTGEIDRLANKAFAEEVAECRASGVGAPSARAWKNSFRVGAASMIQRRLNETRVKVRSDAQSAGQSLVRIDQEALAVKAFIQARVGRTTNKGGPRISSRSGYEAGREAGRGVSLGGGRGSLGTGTKALRG